MHPKKSIIHYLSYILNALIFILFSIWFLQNESSDFLPTLFSIFTVIFVSAIISRSVESIEDIFFMGNKQYSKTFLPNPPDKRTFFAISIGISIWLALLNIFMFVMIKFSNPELTFINAFTNHFDYYLDTPKYLYIAQNSYSAITSDYESYQNIFPLLPLIIRLFSVIGNPYILTVVFNNILALSSGLVLFNIVLLDYDEFVSLKSVVLLFLFPTSFFLIIPLQISLLLFLSLLYVYFIRQRSWFLSFITGIFAGLTDYHASLLLVFAIAEFVSMILEEVSNKRFDGEIPLNKTAMFFIEKQTDKKYYIEFLKEGLCLLGIPLSILVHILFNKNIFIGETGFLLKVYDFIQREKTYFFSNSFKLLLDFSKKNNYKIGIAQGSYLPTIFMIVIVMVILFFGAKKVRGSYLIYSIVFFVVSLGEKNILSVNKYLILIFPLSIICAVISDNLITNIVILMFTMLFLIFYFMSFLKGYPVY